MNRDEREFAYKAALYGRTMLPLSPLLFADRLKFITLVLRSTLPPTVMRPLTLTVSVLGLASITVGQFGPARTLAGMTGNVQHIHLADLDGDGDLDIVTASTDRCVAWFENQGSSFVPHYLPTINPGGSGSVAVADVDGDGHPDLITTLESGFQFYQVFWYPNLGDGRFGEGNLVGSTGSIDGTWLAAGDLTGDGLPDVVHTHWDDLYRSFNNGDGTFAVQPAQLVGGLLLDKVLLADVDADGDLDVFAQTNVGVTLLLNDGSGGLTPTEGVFGIFDLDVADMDGDGDLDVLIINELPPYVKWAPYIGNGQFGPTQSLPEFPNVPKAVRLSDMDGDGDMDVLVAAWLAEPGSMRAGWYANNGNGNFTAPQAIPSLSIMHEAMACGDLNGDGAQDVVLSTTDGALVVHWNDGAGGTAQALPVMRTHTLDHSYLKVGTVQPADLDGDGDLDLLSGHRGASIMENDGNGGFSVLRPLIDSLYAGTSSAALDLDQDGDLDIVAARYTGPLIVLHNDGTGGFNYASSITVNGFGTFNMTVADMDQDGIDDLVFTTDARIHWLRCDGAGGLVASAPFIDTQIVNELKVLDLDGDGDMDYLAATGPNQYQVIWYSNDGTGNFAPGVVISAGSGHGVDAADLDGDGDLDVLATVGYELRWYSNLGNGTFGPAQQLASDNTDLRGLHATDLDGDGLVDILSGSYTTGTLFWHRNLGGGIFGEATTIATKARGVRFLGTFDADGDGDPEVYAACEGGDRLVLLKNYSGSPYRIRGTIYWDQDQSGTREPNEPGFPYTALTCTPALTQAFTGPNGEYTYYLEPGTFTIATQVPNDWWTSTTGQTTLDVTLTEMDPIALDRDFGYAALVDTAVLVLDQVIGTGPCNGATPYWLSYRNAGSTLLEGTLSFLPDPLFQYVAAVPPPDSIVGGTLYWGFDTLQLYEQRSIQVELVRPSFQFMGEPTTNLFSSGSNALGTAPLFTLDHIAVDTVTCAYDPNDKQVVPTGFGTFGAVDLGTDEFIYTIRFQNTGNDVAYTVVVRDVLSDALEPTTLQVLATSHTLTHLSIQPDHEVLFRFENILLPDSGADLMGSQGFIRFRIRPMPGHPSGTAVPNAAAIDFDFNPPIHTNNVINTLVDCGLFQAEVLALADSTLGAKAGIAHQWFLNGIPLPADTLSTIHTSAEGFYSVQVTSIYGCTSISPGFLVGINGPQANGLRLLPNPASTELRLIAPQPLTTDHQIQLLDPQGRVLRILAGNGGPMLIIPRGDLAPGLYLLRVTNTVERTSWAAKVIFQ